MKSSLLTSRRFWTAVLDLVVSLTLFFVGKYFQIAAEDVKFVIGALQPVIGLLIVAYTVDDINQAGLERLRMTLGAPKK